MLAEIEFPEMEWGRIVECPRCGDYGTSHLVAVEVSQGQERYVIKADGPHRDMSGETGLRGSSIRVVFDCENGHLFQIRFVFHKGSTFEAKQFLVDYDPEDGPPQELAGELWRD
jgi:hypothetical protein